MLIPLLGAVLAAVTCLQAPAWGATPPSAGAVAEVPPATRLVALNKNGALEAFARVADGTVWHIGQREPGTDWSDWSTLGGAAATDPVVATNADGRLEVFTTHGGTVSTMASTTTGDSTWSTTWVHHPGATLSNSEGVAVAANQDGRLQVFGLGRDGTVKSLVQTAPGSVYGENWDPWTTMGAPTGVKLIGRPAAAMNSSGQLQVFSWGNNHQLWTRVENKENTKKWSPWKALPTLSGGVQGDPAVARNQDGRLQVFVRGTGDNVYYAAQNKPSQAQWSSWAALTGEGTAFGGVVSLNNLNVAANADGRLEVFAPHSDNSLWHTMQTQPSSFDSWSTPTSLGGTTLGDSAVVANRDGRLEAFSVHGALAHSAQEESNPPPSDKWTDW
ncbi:hypothetical protein ACPC54_38570 [Kitasatospora sp. NPDC094028]